MSTPQLNPETPQDWWKRILFRLRSSPFLPIAVSLFSMVSAFTGLYAFGPIYILAIVISPARWKTLYIASCIGATVGVLILAGMVEYFGPHIVESFFPGLEQRSDWIQYTHWISKYGWIALMIFAALPIPQMPVLFLSALSNISLAKIAIAILIGKLVKYGVYGAVTVVAVKGMQEHK